MTGFVFITISHIFLTLIFVSACSLRNRTYKRLSDILFLSGYVFYIIISCMRKIDYGWGGDDAVGYRIIFEKSDTSFYEYFFIQSQKEYLFRMINWMIRKFTADYRYCLFVFHSITYLCTAYFLVHIKPKGRIIINPFAIYLITADLFFTFHLLRSGVAVSICSVFFILFERKQYKKAFVVLAAAISIHYSAWILAAASIPFVISDKFHISLRNIMKIYLVLAVLFEIIILIKTRGALKFYFMYDNHNGISDGTIAALMVLFVLLVYKQRFDKRYDFYEMMVLTTVLIVPANFFYTIANRMFLLYFPLVYSVIAQVQSEGIKILNQKITLKRNDLLILSFGIVYFAVRIYLIAFRENPAYTLKYALIF